MVVARVLGAVAVVVGGSNDLLGKHHSFWSLLHAWQGLSGLGIECWRCYYVIAVCAVYGDDVEWQKMHENNELHS